MDAAVRASVGWARVGVRPRGKRMRRLGIIVLLAGAVGAGPVMAQSGDANRARCEGSDPDAAIASCTALIQSGQATAKELPTIYFNRGVAHLDNEEYSKAIEDCSEAIRLNPSYGDAFLDRGLAHKDNNEYDLAIQDYDQAIKLNPKDAVAFNDRGGAYASDGKFDRAAQDFTQAIVLDPTDSRAYSNRGAVYYTKQEYDLAIPDLDQAIKLSPHDSDSMRYRGWAKQKSGDKAGGDADVAASEREEARQKNVAQCKNSNGDVQIASCSALIEAGQEAKGDLNLIYARRGMAYLGKKDYDRAIDDFDQSIKLDPSFAALFYLRGNTYGLKAQFDRAIPDFSQAIKLDPEDADSFGSRCFARAIDGELAAALADCDESLRLRKKSGDTDPEKAGKIFATRGFVYLKMKKPDAAIAEDNAALAADPKWAFPLFGRGLAERSKGDTAAAATDIAAAKEDQPDVADQFTKWGVAQ